MLSGLYEMWCRDWESSSYLSYWPPSKRLKSALTERRKGIKYTLPGLKYEFNEKRDVNQETIAIMKCFDSVDQDKNWNGLKKLLDSRQHLSAVEATGKILTLLGQGMDKSGRSSQSTPYSLEIWSIRFQLLFGLKKYSELLDELTSFEELDAPDLFFQYGGENREGSMIPFALRMVHAEALVHSPLPIQAVGRVDRLIADVKTIIGELSPDALQSHVEGWKSRLEAAKFMRARIFHELQKSDLVISTIEDVQSDSDEKDNLSYLLARIHLTRSQEDRALAVLKDVKADNEGRRQHHESLLAMYRGDREKMQTLLEDCNNRDSSAKTINNLSIARLFNGHPQEAASLLIEEARRCIASSEPLHPVMAQNIRTLSEFSFANTTKTQVLKELQSVLPQQ